LTFLCRGGILRGMVFVVGAPGCSPSRTKRTKKQLSLSLSLSFCVCACLFASFQRRSFAPRDER
jgi:hypothetical protein